MKRVLNTYILAVAVLALVVIRLALGTSMPLCVHADAGYDDAWAVRAADFIAQGLWLGPYDSTTLIKGPGFPLFLALCNIIGVDYLFAVTLLYILASMFFMWAVRPFFKRRWVLFVMLAIVLFCPVSFATDTFQRVYRNSITAAQVLIVFGGYLGMFVRIKGLRSADPLRIVERPMWRNVTRVWQRVLPWSIIGSMGLAWFMVTREDSIWVAPFAVVATLVMGAMLVRGRLDGDFGTRGLAVCLVLVLLPCAATDATLTGVKAINQSVYGVSTVAEINSGNFARMVKDLYAIQPQTESDNQRVACTHESLQRAYEASPTLASISAQVEECFYGFGDVIDSDPGDGEVNGGEFFWVIRRAADQAGLYTSASDIDAFYGAIADELEAAFEDGQLAQRSVMPSSIMTPWNSAYAAQLPGAFAGILWQTVSYGDVTCMPYVAEGSDDGIAYFQQVTGNMGYDGTWGVPTACVVGERITDVYRVLGPLGAACGFACAIVLAVQWARERRRDQDRRHEWVGPLLLCVLAILLSVVALVCGLAYSRVSSFVPISYYYYASAAYPLTIAFSALSCIGVVELLRERRAQRASAAGDGEGRG